ncbi:MAG: aspartate kinase [Firmicutes bacterium]|nr:aspartate kinase [Bacillota bacterium]MBR0104505.1 aspartate kinase [Bacillota bacterium]
MLIVQKFGGSSVADAQRIFNVANRIIDTKNEDNQVVVVLSAQGDTTDDLIDKAKEINPKPAKREMDMLLATGEQQSVALMAMALNALGYNAISLNAFQVQLTTTSDYSNAKIKDIDTERIKRELARDNIVLVAGFQGVNIFNDVTTLGRGGSDTTAVAIAAALNADACEIYTDVDGVYTADPRIVKDASKLEEISYDEMLELASLGSKVLHNRSVELAKKYHIPLVVRSSFNKVSGTVVKEDSKMEKMLVSGVAADKDITRISLLNIEDTPGKAFEVFSILGRNDISVDIILQSIGRDGTKDISFTVAKSDAEAACEILEKYKDKIGVGTISLDDNVAKLSIVGAGMATHAGVASLMFEALYDARINISMISTSEIKISVLINKDDVELGMRAIHQKFNLAALNSL